MCDVGGSRSTGALSHTSGTRSGDQGGKFVSAQVSMPKFVFSVAAPSPDCLSSLFSLSLPPSLPSSLLSSLPSFLSPFLPLSLSSLPPQLGCGLPPTSNTRDGADETPPPAPKSSRNTEKLKEWLEFEPATTKDEDMDDLGTLSDYEFGKYKVHHGNRLTAVAKQASKEHGIYEQGSKASV